MNDVGNQITPDGLAALEAELHRLEIDERRAMAERLRTARAWGDLKENSEYHDAKNAQAHLETKIARLRELRRNAVVVEPGAGRGTAGLGVAITVSDLDSDDRSVYLADFGIARPLDDISGITTTNMTVGTVAYAAPEQLIGEQMDARADQYALAATAYHLLTGVI